MEFRTLFYLLEIEAKTNIQKNIGYFLKKNQKS